MSGTDIRAELTRSIVEMLEKGESLPWQKPWNGVPVVPYNALTGKAYKGINQMWLGFRGYEDPRWMTFRQVQALSRQEQTPMHVRKGEKGTPIEKWIFEKEETRFVSGTGRKETVTVSLERPMVLPYPVFNAAQIEGMPPRPREGPEILFPSSELTRHILETLSARVFPDGGDRAFYRRSDDTIHLPGSSAFRDEAGYNSTLLHELVHWTGHESRLKAEFGVFGDERYAFEELRAEIGSYYLNGKLGLANDLKNHVSYVEDWLSLLKKDRHALPRALRLAGQAEEFILEGVLEREREPGIEHRLGTHLKALGLAGFYGRGDGSKTLASPERERESPEAHSPDPETQRSNPGSRTREEPVRILRVPPGGKKPPEFRKVPDRGTVRDDGRGR